MIRIVVLGSGGAVPSPVRNLTSIAMRYFGEVYLFDCAEGTQRQMMKYGISYAKVKAIFISHLHADHILGIPGLRHTHKMIERKEKLLIFGPKGTKKRIEELIGKRDEMVEITEIDEKWSYEIEEGRDKAVFRAFKTNHLPESWGYVFEEIGKRRFDKEKCKELGIKGRMFRMLEEKGEVEIKVKGKKAKKIKIEDVTYVKKGRKIVYTGDTMYSKEVLKNAKDADILLHESTFMEEHRKEADEDKHATVLDAAKIAKEANAGQLVVFHISNRYKDPKEIEKEGKKVFENISVAKDGLEILI